MTALAVAFEPAYMTNPQAGHSSRCSSPRSSSRQRGQNLHPLSSPTTARIGGMPKFVPATVTELSRVELLAGLPGEKLGEIAKRMDREEVPPGRAVVREGDDAERFYVVLSGLFAVSQEDLGPRRVLHPGNYFGEVGLAMHIPRTASVRALTPAVVASCDRATFDELLRPLFADDG
jgi:ATP-binding cassette subfamily B protein